MNGLEDISTKDSRRAVVAAAIVEINTATLSYVVSPVVNWIGEQAAPARPAKQYVGEDSPAEVFAGIINTGFPTGGREPRKPTQDLLERVQVGA